MSSAKEFHVTSEESEYDELHKTVDVQVFPQNLRVTWDDTGCAICMAVLFLVGVSGLISSGIYYHWIKADEAGTMLSETWALFAETGLLICVFFCSAILLSFCLMCLCGLNTQLMAARRRHFGSLRKNRILLSLMCGPSAWDEPDFQRRLRRQERRIERIQTMVEARMDSWLELRAARIKHMLAMRLQLVKFRSRQQVAFEKQGRCNIL